MTRFRLDYRGGFDITAPWVIAVPEPEVTNRIDTLCKKSQVPFSWVGATCR
jgi:hypothetical protein